MKLTLVYMLASLALCLGVDLPSKGGGKLNDSKKNKDKDLVQKRESSFADVSPSLTPGIQYADSKPIESDKSPAQQIYATPVPQVAKISDVLTGHGAFPATITGHLVSPVPIYQPRLASGTTYQVSPPVASQLAYTEHKILYPTAPSGIQYFSNQKLPVQVRQPQGLGRHAASYNRLPFPQDLRYYQQNVPQVIYVSAPQFAPHQNVFGITHQAYQPQIVYSQAQPQHGPQIVYNQPQQQYSHGPQQLVHPAPYYNVRPIPVPVQQAEPSILYANQPEAGNVQIKPQMYQKTETTVSPLPSQQKQIQTETNNGAVSYASFSQSPAVQNYQQSEANTKKPASDQPTNHQDTRLGEAGQHLVYIQQQPQPQQYSLPPQQHTQVLQYQSFPQTRNSGYQQNTPNVFHQQTSPNSFYQQNPPNTFHQQNPPNSFHQQSGVSQPQSLQAPGYTNVQYFGKFAQSIFGNYQQR